MIYTYMCIIVYIYVWKICIDITIYSPPNSSLKHSIGLSHHLRSGMIWHVHLSTFPSMAANTNNQTSRSGKVWPSNINTTMTPPSIFKVGSKKPPQRLWPRERRRFFSTSNGANIQALIVTIWCMESLPQTSLETKATFMSFHVKNAYLQV